MIVRLQSPRTGRYGAARKTGEVTIEHDGRMWSITPRWEMIDGQPESVGLDMREVRAIRVVDGAAEATCGWPTPEPTG